MSFSSPDVDLHQRGLTYMSGGVFALGWFIFIDACVLHAAQDLMPPIEAAHAIPGLVATAAMLMVCVTPFRAFSDDVGSLGRPSTVSCARLWLFSAFLTGFAAVGISVVIAQAMGHDSNSRFAYGGVRGGGAGGEPQHRWVGTAVLLQTVVIFFASMLWMALRLQRSSASAF